MNDQPQVAGAGPVTAPPKPKRRWPSIVLCAVIFLSGFLTGAGLSLVAVRTVFSRHAEHPFGFSGRVLKRMRSRLDLTPRQVEEVRAVFARRQESFEQLRREFRPRMDQELEGLRKDVASVLDQRQAGLWNAWYERRHRWFGRPSHPEEEEKHPEKR